MRVREKATILTRLATLVGSDLRDRPLTDRLCHACQHLLGAQMNLAPDDALAVLKAHAYALHATLADVASRVVRRELDFGR